MIAASREAPRDSPAPKFGLSLLHLALAIATATGLLAWVAVAKLSDLLIPFGPDQGIFSLVGLSILSGEIPYRDIWDNKPPGLYYAYAAVLAWFPGHSVECSPSFLPVAPEQMGLSCGHAAVIAFDLLYTLAIAAAVLAAGRHLLGWHQGLLAAGLFLAFAVERPLGHGGGKPELFILLPLVLAFVLLWRYLQREEARWLVLSGALLGLALLLKQTAVTAGVSMMALLALTGTPHAGRLRVGVLSRKLGWLGAGVAVAVAPVVSYFAAHNSLGELFYAVIGFGLDYVQSADQNFFTRAITSSWRLFRDSQGLLWTLALVGTLQLVPLIKRSRAGQLLLLWAAGDIVAVSLGGGRFFHYYYVQLVPSFALLGAHALYSLWQRAAQYVDPASTAPATTIRLWIVISLAMLFSLSVSSQVQILLRTLHERALHWVPSDAERAASAIRKSPPGPILVWGDASQVYLLAGRRAASRYAHGVAVSHLWAQSGAASVHRRELIHDVVDRQPSVIAIDPWTSRTDPAGTQLFNLSSFPELRAILEHDYMKASVDAGSFELYVRKQ